MTTPGSGPVPPGPWQEASPYAQAPYARAPQAQAPYAQAPYAQAPYAQAPSGQPAFGYDAPPPAPGTAYPPAGYAPGASPPPGAYPPAGGPWGAPPGAVVIPGGPVLQAASPGRRALARLIDSAGYFVVLGGAVALGLWLLVDRLGDVDYSYGVATPSNGDVATGLIGFYGLPVLAVLIIVAYESLMIGLTGSTVGGRLMGVRFVRTSDGASPGIGRALGRAALLGVSLVVCYGLVFLLLLLSMFFDQQPGRYQSWVDKLCGMQAVTTKG